MPPLELDTLTLAAGSHAHTQDAMCVMEAVAYVAGEPWSDHPQCVSPVIASFLRRWNDDLNDADRQMLKPFVARLPGTNTGSADDETRAWLVTDWMVREYLPAWLDAANLKDQADAVRSLSPVTAVDAWEAARKTVSVAGEKSAAAWAAAWDAARDAARAAAWDAAWDAARAAARAAARDAANKALRPTVEGIQQSALNLIDRMIAVGK